MSLLAKFERYPLTFGPTPIEHLPRLSAALGGKVHVYAKRDDCNSGLAMGGNKLRKLEYIVPDALRSGADTLVSIGGVQSNHTRMVAATAAKIGMKCVVIQEKWVPHYDAVYDRVGNILMTRLMGADSRLVDDGFDIGIRKSWEDAIQSVKDAGGKPYPIPAGASVHKFGGLGYVGFAEEVARQEAELGFAFDYMIVCVVTGSTQAGMIVGFAAQNRADRVIGIDASNAVLISAKTGLGIPDVLEAIVHQLPPPREGDLSAPLKAMLVDSWYDAYLGVIVLVRVIDGVLKKGQTIRMMGTGAKYLVERTGVFTPARINVDELGPGEFGFFTGSIKEVADTRVGDTITEDRRPTQKALP
ncbi:MAG: 1-aminocyclopropane-1-carboxylate deaminase, partial [Mesorhizobium sp.]